MSAAYHTAECHGQPDCHCLSDHQHWADECETPSNWEVIAYWVSVAIATACTVAVIAGTTGYVYATFCN